MQRASGLLALTAHLAASPSARAQTSADRAAEAQVLFDQALDLMGAGRAAEACPKLAEAQRLDPGMGTQYRLAECYETIGHLASAWALYTEVADAAGARKLADREAVARRRAAAIEPRLSRMTIVVPPALAEVDGLEVRRDGGFVGRALWGTPVPVDPGEHIVSASAPGRRTWESKVTASSEAGRLTTTIPELEATPVTEPDAPRALPPDVPPRSLVPGLVLGSVAVAGLGSGAAFLGISGSRRSDASAMAAQILGNRGSCVSGASNDDAVRCPTLQRTLKADDTFHDLAVGAFVAGGVAAAGAATYFLWPRRPARSSARGIRVTPVPGAGAGSVTLSGSF